MPTKKATPALVTPAVLQPANPITPKTRWCIVCGVQFEAKRVDQLYHSGKHRDGCWGTIVEVEMSEWRSMRRFMAALELQNGECVNQETHKDTVRDLRPMVVNPRVLGANGEPRIVASCRECRGIFYRELALRQPK